jgi:Lrp/AsnC family leucine-responsive transcriptional regulator
MNNLENPDKLLDRVGWHILALLHENARLSFTEIGKQVGLSDTGVADRIRRMEDAGILRGYRADIDYTKVGLPVLAFVRVNVYASPLSEAQIEALIQATPQIIACYSLAGADCYLFKVATTSLAHLDRLLVAFRTQGNFATVTSIVLSSLFEQRNIDPSVYQEPDGKTKLYDQ